jgi:hypothetical protein
MESGELEPSLGNRCSLFLGSELGDKREATGRSVGGPPWLAFSLRAEDPLELHLTMELMGCSNTSNLETCRAWYLKD